MPDTPAQAITATTTIAPVEDMASINPAIIPRLVQLSAALSAAKHGEGKALKDAACQELGMSHATLHRALHQVSVRSSRKQRHDAGLVQLLREDALKISALLQSSARKTGKRLMAIGQAVDTLIANAEINTEYTVPTTGEIKRLSTSAIASALRAYGLHPDQLNRPAPAVELRSLYPNHVWQIDASICVLYYLRTNSPREVGLQVMDREKFYKNKPANLKSIEADRVWSYEVTDHYSGAIFAHYVMGAESAANLTESFIECAQKRDGDPFHGVPTILMMDMGSANTSGLFANLARRLGVALIAHAPGNARATGQVEKARDQIERSFESGLRLSPVANLQQLNERARKWARWYNASKIHSRHGQTRIDMWLTIQADQLRIAPSRAVCQELLSTTPESRKVKDTLRIDWKGEEFDVSTVPNIMVGEKLSICTNPYNPATVQVLLKDADGHELLHLCPMVPKDEAGFATTANVIGEDYARPKDTRADTNRKEVDRAIYGVPTDEAAELAKKQNITPFAGRIDPQKLIDATPVRNFLPKRGTALDVKTTTTATAASARTLSAFEAAQALSASGIKMTADIANTLRTQYAQGVPEDELDALKHRFAVRSSLKVVNGGRCDAKP